MDNLPELRKIIEKAKLELINYKIWNHKDNLKTDLTNIPLKVGSRVWRGVLLEDDTQIRLGSPKYPTVLSVICQSDTNGIHHGRITLIGPDISSIPNGENLFGLVVIIGGSKINSENVNRLRSTIYISDQIEEFELSSNLKQRRFKIGKGICNRGISFEHIGEALIKLFLDTCGNLIESIEIILITKGESLVKDLIEFDKTIRKDYIESMKNKIAKYTKLRDDCDFDWECKSCDYQKVCEEIRGIMVERNKALKNK